MTRFETLALRTPAFGYLLVIVGIRYFCFVKRQDLTPITEPVFERDQHNEVPPS